MRIRALGIAIMALPTFSCGEEQGSPEIVGSEWCERSRSPAHHTVLFYVSSEPMTASRARPLVAYLDPEGRPLDWMFDGMLLYDRFLHREVVDGRPHPTPADLANYERKIFDEGQARELADAVRTLRIELNDPSYRLKIYLPIPYLSGPDGIPEARRLIGRFHSLGLPELELVGMYWSNEYIFETETMAVRSTADFVHEQGLQFFWIPYFSSRAVSDWKSFGFDFVNLQPNFAFQDVDASRFREADERRRAYDLAGIELEFGRPRNGSVTEETNALAYLEAADRYNWGYSPFRTYYHATPIIDYSRSGNPNLRRVYDGLYRGIMVHPRASVARRALVAAAGDTFTQRRETDTTSALGVALLEAVSGSLTGFSIGTNSYPNWMRAFLRFQLPSELAVARVLAVYLQLDRRALNHPDGSRVEDAVLHVQSGLDWSEATLNGRTEPDLSGFRLVGHHYFALDVTERYAFEVTDAVRSELARGQNDLTFRLARESETGRAQAVFRSREGGAATAPYLVVVYAP